MGPMSKTTLNFKQRSASYCFSGYARMKLPRTHGPRFSSLQRRISSRNAGVRSPLPIRSGAYFSAQTVRKRYFSETLPLSLDNQVPPIAPSNIDSNLQSPNTASPTGSNDHRHDRRRQDVALDKFTHFALNSHTIPLGSMLEENWLDILDAVDAWLNIGGGFAADSAERLLERLVTEQAASFSRKKSSLASSYSHRPMILADLQRDVLNAWIEVFNQSEGNSRLAIVRAEQALFRLLDMLAIVEKSTKHSRFPIEEYMAIVEGYLHPNRQHEDGLHKAGILLLRLASKDNDKWNLALEDHRALIGPMYEQCTTQLLANDSATTLVAQLLESMTVMKETGICPEMTIPDITERILLDATSQHASNPEKATIGTMSPFEVQVAENRLVDLLQTANEDDRDTIRGLVQKLSSTRPRSEVVAALVDYYTGMGDSESASYWLQKLEVPLLVSSYNLVEDVLESWQTQKSSRIPWRADEVFKEITNKIQDHGEESIISSKSIDLMIGIWAASEDPSSSRKIVDWYSQMKSWMIKPDASLLKTTVQALFGASIDNPLEIVSSDLLQHWDSFPKEDKVDIANAILEVISSESEISDTIFSLVDRFRADNVISDKSLLQTLLAAVKVDAPPSDVLAIVHSFDNTTEVIDLSLYALAIDTLFKLKKDAKTEIQSLYGTAMRRFIANRDATDPNDLSNFLHGVISMHAHRKLYADAERCLKKAENTFLSKYDAVQSNHSPIPLECYKKIIVRNWYTEKTAQKVEESFEKLMKLYHRGYVNLQPDCDVYTAYIDARAVAKKDVEGNLEEMIELYESSGIETLKPQAKVFNTVLLSLAQDKRNTNSLPEKSVNLLNRMSNLGVQPDIKTLNLVLKNAIKGKSKNVYKLSTMLMERIQSNNLIPDIHTLHLIIDACGLAPPDDREDALKRCLLTFGEIRKQNFIVPITYGILSKVAYRLTSRGARADKVGESLLTMCCDDGMLTSEVRGRLQSMMSRSAWEKHFVGRLSADGRHPEDWNCNIQQTN